MNRCFFDNNSLIFDDQRDKKLVIPIFFILLIDYFCYLWVENVIFRYFRNYILLQI
jgi:hypothetical protein